MPSVVSWRGLDCGRRRSDEALLEKDHETSYILTQEEESKIQADDRDGSWSCHNNTLSTYDGSMSPSNKIPALHLGV